MTTYMSKPRSIEAMQWTGENNAEVMQWTGDHVAKDLAGYDDGTELLVFVPLAYPQPKLFVAANNAYVPVAPGEWILRDKLGFYPCKDEVFRMNYQEYPR